MTKEIFPTIKTHYPVTLRNRERIVKSFNYSGMHRRFFKIKVYLKRHGREFHNTQVCNID